MKVARWNGYGWDVSCVLVMLWRWGEIFMWCHASTMCGVFLVYCGKDDTGEGDVVCRGREWWFLVWCFDWGGKEACYDVCVWMMYIGWDERWWRSLWWLCALCVHTQYHGVRYEEDPCDGFVVVWVDIWEGKAKSCKESVAMTCCGVILVRMWWWLWKVI